MEDQELLAAIGLVVVNVAALDYAIAVLTAALEGAGTERASDLASTPGKARKALTKIAKANRDRLDIRMLAKAANELFEDRGILAHSIVLADTEYSGQPTYSIWNPKRDAKHRSPSSNCLSTPRPCRPIPGVRTTSSPRRTQAWHPASLSGRFPLSRSRGVPANVNRSRRFYREPIPTHRNSR